jgi:hypothetical protein
LAVVGGVVLLWLVLIAALWLVLEFTAADNYGVSDSALWCADGDLLADSAPLLRPFGGHRSSPWYRALESARSRYRIWAASQWEQKFGARPPTQQLINGVLHDLPAQTNPFLDTVSA